MVGLGASQQILRKHGSFAIFLDARMRPNRRSLYVRKWRIERILFPFLTSVQRIRTRAIRYNISKIQTVPSTPSIRHKEPLTTLEDLVIMLLGVERFPSSFGSSLTTPFLRK